MTSIMLTGHRYVDPTAYANMQLLLGELQKEHGDSLTVISGGNLGTKTEPTGADRYWALAAFTLGIPYEIYVPSGYGINYYVGNADMYRRWDTMLNNASKVVIIGDTNKPFDWRNNFVRNTKMVQDADMHVVCSPDSIAKLLKDLKGGTAHATKEMKRLGVHKVYHIDPTQAGYKIIPDLQKVE